MNEYDEWSLTVHYEETDNWSDEAECPVCGGWGYNKQTGEQCQFCGGDGVKYET